MTEINDSDNPKTNDNYYHRLKEEIKEICGFFTKLWIFLCVTPLFVLLLMFFPKYIWGFFFILLYGSPALILLKWSGNFSNTEKENPQNTDINKIFAPLAGFLHNIFLFRVPIIGGSVLFFLPIISNIGIFQSFLQNLFFVENEQQLWMLMLCSAVTSNAITSSIKGIYHQIKNNNDKPYFIALLLTIFFLFPTWIYLYLNNSQETELVRFIILVFTSIISFIIFQFLEKFLEKFSQKEWSLLIQFLIGLFLYILFIYLNFPQLDGSTILVKEWQPPTLLYLYLIIWILSIYFAGITYLSDKFSSNLRNSELSNKYYLYIPVVIILIIFSACSYGVWSVDHFFKLEDSPVIIRDYQQDFQQAIWNRLCEERFDINSKTQTCNKDKEQSLVVVAASGGGIQASGWMAQILAGLQDQDLGIGEDFIKAIGLISSTSGGSVGSMFYLDQFENGVLSKDGLIKQDNNGLTKVVENSTDDWLNSVGWGLAFPDLFRAIGLHPLLHPFRKLGGDSKLYLYLDRGYALEKNWQKTLTLVNNKPPTLDDRREQTLGGKIPIAVYNTTLVENGRPFLVSSMKFVPGTMADYANESSQQTVNNTALDFKTLYNNCGTNGDQSCDLALTTAARLSASFPYVTPMARNDRENIIKLNNKDGEKNILQNYHVADGGYYDNAGGFTAMNWLNNFLEYNNSKKNKGHRMNIKKVMILQINAFPEDNLKLDQLGSPGFIVSTIGPLNTLAGIRDSTQIGRNKIFAELLKARWNNDKNDQNNIEIQDFTISFPPKDLDGRDYNPPLSWRLTQAQKQNLVEAWENNTNIRNTVEKMKAFWNFSDGHK